MFTFLFPCHFLQVWCSLLDYLIDTAFCSCHIASCLYLMPLASMLTFLAPISLFETDGFFFLSDVKHFHSRMVSSAAALATVLPSGDIARHRMRAEWPCRSATRVMAGYFQIVNWFCMNPWPEINSLYSLDHKMDDTYNRQRDFFQVRMLSRWYFYFKSEKPSFLGFLLIAWHFDCDANYIFFIWLCCTRCL